MSGLGDFCGHALRVEGRACSDDPRQLAGMFREFFALEGTPKLGRVLDLMSSLGVTMEEVQYLETGAVNMFNGGWHVHFAFKDPPGTQKFDLLHEAYEIVDKTFKDMVTGYSGIREPSLSRNADRFAAAVLMPPEFISVKMAESGCDPVLLGEELELSHQALLVAFAERLQDTPYVGALWDLHAANGGSGHAFEDFEAAFVTRSGPARHARMLCASQPVPKKGSGVAVGSLACLAVKTGRPVLSRPEESEGAAAVLLRPMPWRGHGLGRLLLVAVLDEEYHLLQPQVERLDHAPLRVPSRAAPACRFEQGFRGCADCAKDSFGEQRQRYIEECSDDV